MLVLIFKSFHAM
jgi:hypothetical protein